MICTAAVVLAASSPASAAPHWGRIERVVAGKRGLTRVIDGAAIDDRRNALVVWSEGSDAPVGPAVPVRTVVARRRSGGRFGAVQLLNDTFGATFASNGHGDVIAIWEKLVDCGSGAFCNDEIWMAAGTVAGGFGRAVRLTSGASPVVRPAVAIGARGDAVVAWSEEPAGGVVRAVYRPHGGADYPSAADPRSDRLAGETQIEALDQAGDAGRIHVELVARAELAGFAAGRSGC